MKIEITYPTKKRTHQRQDVINWAKWPFLFAAYICPIINITLGGTAWSIIVLYSLWIVWTNAVSPNLVEYNRISQLIKLITNASILLILVNVVFSFDWAERVVPIVCFGGFIIAGILFFTDLNKQRQNMMPMLLLIIICIPSSVAGVFVYGQESRWSLVVMGAIAFALLIACFIVLRKDFINELKKRFHIK